MSCKNFEKILEDRISVSAIQKSPTRQAVHLSPCLGNRGHIRRRIRTGAARTIKDRALRRQATEWTHEKYCSCHSGSSWSRMQCTSESVLYIKKMRTSDSRVIANNWRVRKRDSGRTRRLPKIAQNVVKKREPVWKTSLESPHQNDSIWKAGAAF